MHGFDMIGIINVFSWLIQIVALVTTAFVGYILYRQPDDSEISTFLNKQVKSCKRALVILFVLGWFFGDPNNMERLPGTFRIIGICWLVVGILFMLMILLAAIQRIGSERIKALLSLSVKNLSFGMIIALTSILLWSY